MNIEYFASGLAGLGTNITLENGYKGVRPGDIRLLTNTQGFGPHWNGRLGDLYEIKEVVVVSGGSPTEVKDVNVIAELIKDRYRATLGVDSFLPNET